MYTYATICLRFGVIKNDEKKVEEENWSDSVLENFLGGLEKSSVSDNHALDPILNHYVQVIQTRATREKVNVSLSPKSPTHNSQR